MLSWRPRVWASFFAEPVLLLLLLLDTEVSNTGQFEDTMDVSEDNRTGAVGVDPRVVDLEHEPVRCRCEQ